MKKILATAGIRVSLTGGLKERGQDRRIIVTYRNEKLEKDLAKAVGEEIDRKVKKLVADSNLQDEL